MLTSIKFADDSYFDNGFYAQVGGVTIEDLNRLESEFLFLIQFDLHVMPTLYSQYFGNIKSHYIQLTDQSVLPVQTAPQQTYVKPLPVCESVGSIKTIPSNVDLEYN